MTTIISVLHFSIGQTCILDNIINIVALYHIYLNLQFIYAQIID